MLPSSLDGMISRQEGTGLHHMGLISALDKVFHREVGGLRGIETVMPFRTLSQDGMPWPLLYLIGHNPGIPWEGLLEIKHQQARLIDGHLGSHLLDPTTTVMAAIAHRYLQLFFLRKNYAILK